MVAPRLDPAAIAGARRTRRRRRTVLGVLLLVVVVLGAVVFSAVTSATDARWRTAAAAVHDVRSTIDGIASIEPVREATVAFPVAGTVQTVTAVKGARVQAGQSLAALDPTSLTQTLHQRQATLAAAQLTLQKAIDAQIAATSTTAGPTTTSGSSLAQQIAAAQRAVIGAQRTVDTALAQAAAAVSASQAPCAAPSTGPELAACRTALNDVTVAQANVQTAQRQLAAATDQLDALLVQQANTSTTGGSRTPTTAVPSAADIAADQAAVDAAQLSVNVAEQNLTAATLTSPIDGTVVAVDLVVGQTVAADSTTQTIVVQGTGGFEATMTVSVDLIPKVRVGQEAFVLPDAATVPVAARVALISLAPVTGTVGTSTTYRVTLALQGSSTGLAIGSIGTASIVTASASQVLAVPTSAVHTDATTGERMVTVLEGSTTFEAVVGIGIIGKDRTQLTSGLVDGAVVVLADLREPLPGSATSSGNATGATPPGGGALPGGGPGGGNLPAPPGGFGGGGGGGGPN